MKVCASPTDALCARVSTDHEGKVDSRFTLAWIDAHIQQDHQYEWWNDALSQAWEQLQEDVDAENVFNHAVEVVSEGRSSGWAMIKGWTRETVEGWDAVAVARWTKFAKYARQTVDDMPYQYLSLIYMNVFEPWVSNQDAAQAYIDGLKPAAVL